MNNAFLYNKKIKIFILFFLLGLFFFSKYKEEEIKEKVYTFFFNFFLKKVRNNLNENIIIKYASINFLEKKFILHDIKIIDHHRFSFIHLSECQISIDSNLLYFIFINSDHLKIKNIFIENFSCFIKKYSREKENNLLFFIRNFRIQNRLNKSNIKFISCSKLTIKKSYLYYKNIDSNKKLEHFFSISAKKIKVDNKNKKIKASIFSFQSKELKNKFPTIENIFCDIILYHYPYKIKVYKFFIETPESYLKGDFSFSQFQYKKNPILFPKIHIQCKIYKGSKLGSDIGVFFSKKWNFSTKVFIHGNIHGKLNHKEKIFFLYDFFIKNARNKLFSNKIYIIYKNKKCKKIKLFKTFIQFNPHDIKKIIPYDFDSKLEYLKFFLNLKQCFLYKGDFTFSLLGNSKNFKIKGIVKNHFFLSKIYTYVDCYKNQYKGKILTEIKFFTKKKKTEEKNGFIPFSSFIYKKLSNLDSMSFKGTFSSFFLTLFFSHSKYKMNFIGKIFPYYPNIFIDVYNNKTKKNIKIIFYDNQFFQKININIYDIIIGHISIYKKYKNSFKISCPKRKEIQGTNFNFLIKKSFFDLIKLKTNRNTFSDIKISGEKKGNIFKIIFCTKKIQLNDFFIKKLFITLDNYTIVDNFMIKRINIHAEKIFYKNFSSRTINIFILNQKNFWIINSKFFFTLNNQKYEKQILNFLCKKEKNFFFLYPFISTKLNLNGDNWMIDFDYCYPNLGIIKIDLINQKYIVDNLIFYSKKQKIFINVNWTNEKKILQFYIKNVQLKKILYKKYNINGLINGFFIYKNIYNQVNPNINIEIKSFSIGKIILGNFSIYSFHRKKSSYELVGVIRKNSCNFLKLFGNIKNESNKKSKLDLDIIIPSLEINNFSSLSFLKKINSEANGIVTGKIQVSGYLNDLHYSGKLKIKNFGIKNNSENTNYKIKNPVYINIFSKHCTLSSSYFEDTKYKTRGCINGFFLHKNLIQWDLMKFYINTKNLLVLDLDEKQNKFLFGKIFFNGKVQITKKENHIYIYMNNGKILNFSHLYINPSFQEKNVKKKLNTNKDKNCYLFINVNTLIDKNTRASIFLDENHFIEFRGEGFLFIKKTCENDTHYNGKYFVKDGLYHFYKKNTFPIKLEKKFKIKSGGSISWNNNFYQSNINLIVYDTKYVYNVVEYMNLIKKNPKVHKNNMILTELRIHISGNFQKPNINMEILFPESNEEIQKKLSDKLNSFEEKEIQFLSILILGKFLLKNETIKNFIYFSIYDIFLKRLKIKNILSS
ncbi:translocation/assembly module TamB domain-containing protein [Blattabacterium cuenoti]|uniref:translocation/assembly module TamB domain-containing protein n=1 Tax=Blattabacterium cuenoti TaxID=1653831 RepID=UPI00163BFF43|nr:translocation/assembly module TamB domain-containing protein [Blattabacterium cuenoti]